MKYLLLTNTPGFYLLALLFVALLVGVIFGLIWLSKPKEPKGEEEEEFSKIETADELPAKIDPIDYAMLFPFGGM